MAMQSSLDPKHIKDFESIYIEISMANYFIWSITILLFKCLGHISKCSHTSMIKKHIVDSDSTRSCIKVFDAQA